MKELQFSRRAMLGGLFAVGGAAALPFPALAMWDGTAPFPATQAFLDGFVAARKLPGALATIGRGADAYTLLTAGTQAMDSARAVDADTLWRIYSMTKPITGMAAMMLIGEGKLSLDQTLADILPAYKDMKVQVTPDGSMTDLKPAKSPITIRNLLTHTSGLGYSIIQKGPIKDAYVAAGLVPGQVSRIPMPGLGRGTPVPSLSEFAERLATMPLVYEPGTQWSYSVGLDLMGRVIEVVSGVAFDTFLQSRIFGPLGMTSTWFSVPAGETHRLSTNYSPFAGALIPVDPGSSSIYLDTPAFPFGGAGLVSSARDYDRFLQMLLGAGAIGDVRIMDEATAKLGMSNLLEAGVVTKGTMIDGSGFGAGGRASLPTSATGASVFGWGGAAGTIAFVDQTRQLRAAGYAQYMPSDAYDFQSKFGETVYRDMM